MAKISNKSAKKSNSSKNKNKRSVSFYITQLVIAASLAYVLFPWAPNPKAAENPVIELSTEQQCNLDIAAKKLNTSLPESDKLNPCVTVAPLKPVEPTVKRVTVLQVAEDVPTAVQMGQQLAAARGWTGENWNALYVLWMRESGWNPRAVNRRSGACGIPQALPCSKIPDKSTAGQIRWGLDYIQRRYGTPIGAMSHWQQKKWY
jgi:hypothetical protein